MSTLAITLIVFSAFLHALKSFLTKQSRDKQVFLWSYSAISLILYFPVFLYFILTDSPSLEDILFWCTLSGFINFLCSVSVTKAYDHGDLSLVYPIMRSSPALVLVCAIAFLHEEVTSTGVLGIILVTLGTYLINMTHLDFKSFFAPIKSLFSDKATQFALLAMLLVTAYSIVDKMAVRYMHPVVFTYLLTTASVVFYTPYVFSIKSLQTFKKEWQTNSKAIIINSIIDQGGYFLIIFTYTFENVSYTTGLRQLSTVFAVIMGNHFLKEKNMYIRLCATLVILIGSLFISIA